MRVFKVCETLKTQVKLNLNFTRKCAILSSMGFDFCQSFFSSLSIIKATILAIIKFVNCTLRYVASFIYFLFQLDL
jgi:hypothetical protein